MCDQQSDFFDACHKDNTETIDRMYNDDPAIIDLVDVRGYSPLVIAVSTTPYTGELSMVEMLENI